MQNAGIDQYLEYRRTLVSQQEKDGERYSFSVCCYNK